MKTHNKMMIAVGALALTATTLLAGCGGSSTASTAASEPAAAESPPSLTDGLVKPADVSDDDWAGTIAAAEAALADLTPEQLAAGCKNPLSQERIAEGAKASAQEVGGSVEEWLAFYAALNKNLTLIGCSMVE